MEIKSIRKLFPCDPYFEVFSFSYLIVLHLNFFGLSFLATLTHLWNVLWSMELLCDQSLRKERRVTSYNKKTSLLLFKIGI